MFSRRMKSLVACCAMLALLLCQAVGLAQAHQLGGSAGDAASGCHAVPHDGSDSGKAAHSTCESGLTAGEAVKVPAIAPAILSLPASSFEQQVKPGKPGWTRQVAFAGAPPPIHLLHCRLRN
jgi:hypothetical protein